VTVRIERLDPVRVPWSDLRRARGHTVFATPDWLRFLAATQRAEPLVLRLDGDATGWFVGAVVRRGPLRILGSPLPGWTTPAMGFSGVRSEELEAALDAVRRYALLRLGCLHLEVMQDDPVPTSLPPGFHASPFRGYRLGLVADDDALLGAMRAHGRRDVRRSLRNGIVVEEVDPSSDPTFLDEHWAQVSAAFARRGLRPTFPRSRLDALATRLGGTDLVVCLRARTAEGEPAATGIFPGLAGGTAWFWMGGSERRLQALLPNEAMIWHALRAWRDRGATAFDFGGGGTYKAKYGGAPTVRPWLRASALPGADLARTVVRRSVRARQLIRPAPPAGPR